MLDIIIFRVNKEIVDHGKKVGSIPAFILGGYAPIPEKILNRINHETKALPEEKVTQVIQMLMQIGALDLYATYAKILNDQHSHPFVRKVVENQQQLLQRKFGYVIPTDPDGNHLPYENVVRKRNELLRIASKDISDAQFLGILMTAKKLYENGSMTKNEQDILGRGIICGVGQLRGNPELDRELAYLKIDPRHRGTVLSGVYNY